VVVLDSSVTGADVVAGLLLVVLVGGVEEVVGGGVDNVASDSEGVTDGVGVGVGEGSLFVGAVSEGVTDGVTDGVSEGVMDTIGVVTEADISGSSCRRRRLLILSSIHVACAIEDSARTASSAVWSLENMLSVYRK